MSPPERTVRELPLEVHDARTASRSLDALGWDGLVALCRQQSARWAPEPVVGLDAREALPVVWSEARARRLSVSEASCVVCEAQTCPAVDRRALPGGDEAWLTPNLYPIVYPFDGDGDGDGDAGGRGDVDGARTAEGVHLVHWSCRRHDGGWRGAERATACALLAQLADAEGWLLHHAPAHYPASGGDGHRGHAGVIKNRGRRVGGSVEHDHQQILLSATPFAEPPRTHGLGARLLRDTPDALVVETVDERATLLVPAFMRRPLHAFLVPHAPDGSPARDVARGEPVAHAAEPPVDGRAQAHASPGGDAAAAGWLHHLDVPTRDALAVAVARLTAAVDDLMAAAHGEPAWNLVLHAGEGCDPLFELRPFTQPLGGFEHLGLYLCEERPETSAGRLREALRGGG